MTKSVTFKRIKGVSVYRNCGVTSLGEYNRVIKCY